MEKKITNIYNIYLKKVKEKFPSTTYANQLNKYCKKYFGNKFIGVFPSDKIKRLKKNQSCIINTHPSNKGGEHWCALARNKQGEYYFYDSFGRNLKQVMPKLKKIIKKKIYYDTSDAEQQDNQKDCGARCVVSLFIFYKYGMDKALLL